MAVINEFSHPYGLGGGVFLSGSVTSPSGYYYVYYPLTSSVANIKMNNIISGSQITGSFAAGLPIYGTITSVTQSSGVAFLYNALRDQNDL